MIHQKDQNVFREGAKYLADIVKKKKKIKKQKENKSDLVSLHQIIAW